MLHDVIIAKLRMRIGSCPRGTRSQRPGLEREHTDRVNKRKREEKRVEKKDDDNTRAHSFHTHSSQREVHFTLEKMLLTNYSSVLLNMDKIL